jgi:hypothetical protein
MNATQRQQWDDFACMSRALIKAALVKGIQLTEDGFCSKYESYFPLPQTHYGGLILSRFYRIAIDIGFGNDMDLICHHKDAKEKFDSGSLVFVVSGLHLAPNRCDPFNHTSVLLAIDDQSFTVDSYPPLTVADWIGKRCCGIVFY